MALMATDKVSVVLEARQWQAVVNGMKGAPHSSVAHLIAEIVQQVQTPNGARPPDTDAPDEAK
jgi:hypothetical protein